MLSSDSNTESIYMENLKPLQFSNMDIINDEKQNLSLENKIISQVINQKV